MAKEFNYKRAWAEWAKPQFDELPEPIRQLYKQTTEESDQIKQVVTPTCTSHCEGYSPDLWDKFKAMAETSPASLAWASKVIYYLGHHASDRQWNKKGQNWKFEILAKRALIEAKKGEMLHQAEQKVRPIMDGFMDHKEGTPYSDDEMGEVLNGAFTSQYFTVLKGDHVNFKPHPFVIGIAHMRNSQGMYLNPRSAPCAMRGCGLSYDQHKDGARRKPVRWI